MLGSGFVLTILGVFSFPCAAWECRLSALRSLVSYRSAVRLHQRSHLIWRTHQRPPYDAEWYPKHPAYIRTDWLFIPNWYLDVRVKWVADRNVL